MDEEYIVLERFSQLCAFDSDQELRKLNDIAWDCQFILVRGAADAQDFSVHSSLRDLVQSAIDVGFRII